MISRLVSFPMLPDRAQRVVGEWRRCVVHREGFPPYKMILDSGSNHGLDRQRGYMVCKQPRHHKWFRWHYLDQASSRLEYCAYPMAWATCIVDKADRSEHMHDASDPSDLQITLVCIEIEDL